MRYNRAIVRPPGPTFAQGLTTSLLGVPDPELALAQHGRYCEALRRSGVDVTVIEAQAVFPDGTFVEDAAVVTGRGAIVTRPGAATRTGETDSVAAALRRYFQELRRIEPPGFVDGGDVCEADGHFLIGVSARTNEPGALQLRAHLEALGYSASLVDIRHSRNLLHLKTGLAYIGDGVWVMAPDIAREVPALAGIDPARRIDLSADESPAANCIRVNDDVLVAAGHPQMLAELERRGFRAVPLDLSEFRKMDGGLSCLSLRFRT